MLFLFIKKICNFTPIQATNILEIKSSIYEWKGMIGLGKSKFVKFIMIGVLVASCLFIPTFFFNQDTGAESNIVVKEKVKDSKGKSKVKQVEYKGKIYRDLETHYYLFSTSKKGKIDISWGTDMPGSDYIITDEAWNVMYGNGDELPPGDYMLVITSNPAENPEDPSLLDYHFILKGLTFKGQPDTTLHELTIESPVELVTFLPEGNHAVTFKGSSNAINLTFGTFGLEEDITESLSSPFEKILYFDETSPIYNAYRITAKNESGNSVNRYFEIIYENGVAE